MLTNIDFIIMFIYLCILIFIGYISGKESKSSDDFFIANRQMTWLPIALSIAATNISGNSFIGGPGWSYSHGMNPFMINIAVPFACFFTIWIIVPIIYHLKIISIYEYINLRFGEKTKLLLILHFFINSIIQVSSMIFIPSLFLMKMTGWSLNIIVPIIVTCSIVYTAMGGIKAVIWTDVFQMIIVWGSIFLIIFLAFREINLPFTEFLFRARDLEKLNTLNFSLTSTKENTIWGTLLGGSILWIRYFAFDQTQVQRVLTANSIKSVKRSIFTSAIIMNLVYFLLLFIGVILFFFYKGQNFQNSNEIMINFLLKNIPSGLLGLVIAGIFASVMSSVDSILNSMTTIFIKDIYEGYLKKDNTKKTSKSVTIISSLIFGGIITFFVIIGFGNSIRSILDTVGLYISYLVGPACAIFILGIFSKKINDNQASLGLILGLILGFITASIIKINWIWNPFIGFFITILACIISNEVSNTSASNENKKYTIYEIIKNIKNKKYEDNEKGYYLPGRLDKFSLATLIFFLLQYIFLFILQK